MRISCHRYAVPHRKYLRYRGLPSCLRHSLTHGFAAAPLCSRQLRRHGHCGHWHGRKLRLSATAMTFTTTYRHVEQSILFRSVPHEGRELLLRNREKQTAPFVRADVRHDRVRRKYRLASREAAEDYRRGLASPERTSEPPCNVNKWRKTA